MNDSDKLELVRADRESLGLQVAGGAHHLNNIFAQVLLNAELLDRSRLDETAVGMLDSIVEGVHSAIRVVSTLAGQATTEHGELVSVNLKYLLKGFQKQKDVFFGEGAVINAQYPPEMGSAWARPAPLLRAVIGCCRKAVEAAAERQALFVQVADLELPSGEPGVCLDVGLPPALVDDGLEPGPVSPDGSLGEIAGWVTDSGGELLVEQSDAHGTVARFRYPCAPQG